MTTLPISVVIPAYNSERVIGRAIESVLLQTPEPVEIIVVDDGSTDDTAAVARGYAGVRVITQKNGGPGSARNTGIMAAYQPWIALLDADDVWHADKIKTQWEALIASGVDLCATDFAYVHPDERTHTGGMTSNRGYAQMTRDAAEERDGVFETFERTRVARALVTGMFLLPSTVLFRKRLVTDSNVWFLEREDHPVDLHVHLPEDLEWFLRILRETDVVLVRQALVDYTVSGSGLSANAGRMRYGDVKLGELVRLNPEPYAPGVEDAFDAVRLPRLREATIAFMRRLEIESARLTARTAYDERKHPIDGFLLLLAHVLDLPILRRWATAARTVWRARHA